MRGEFFMLTFKDKLWCFFPGCDVAPWSTPGLRGQLHSSLDWCWCHRVPASAWNEGTVIVLTLILQHPEFILLTFSSCLSISSVQWYILWMWKCLLFQACNLSEYSLACFAYGQEFCPSDLVLFKCVIWSVCLSVSKHVWTITSELLGLHQSDCPHLLSPLSSVWISPVPKVISLFKQSFPLSTNKGVN